MIPNNQVMNRASSYSRLGQSSHAFFEIYVLVYQPVFAMPDAAVDGNAAPVPTPAINSAVDEPPRARPQYGAEIFASIPQSVFFMLMIHVMFAPSPNMRPHPAASSTLPVSPGTRYEGQSSVGPNIQHPTLPVMQTCLWKLEDPFEMFVYLSTSNETLPAVKNSSAPSESVRISDRSTDSSAAFLPGVLMLNSSTLLWHEVQPAARPQQSLTIASCRNHVLESLPISISFLAIFLLQASTRLTSSSSICFRTELALAAADGPLLRPPGGERAPFRGESHRAGPAARVGEQIHLCPRFLRAERRAPRSPSGRP